MLDDVDAGWDAEEAAQTPLDDADLDAGWDAVEAAKTPEEREREWRGLTPEERKARAARAAARKEKLRAKAAEKGARRQARASIAKAKQKQKQKIQRPRNERELRESQHRQADAPVVRESTDVREPEKPSRSRSRSPRNDLRGFAFLLASIVVVVAAGVAGYLWKH